MEKVYRLHYRAQLVRKYKESELKAALDACEERVRDAQRKGRVLTAGLYYYGQMLFLYYEAVGGPLAVAEPQAVKKISASEEATLLPESGEDVQLDVIYPAELLNPLEPFLQAWPGQNGDRLWVHMYHIYYHSVPESPEDWRRKRTPELRRGRIAFLREDKLFGYTYYHKAIVDEGLLYGDRYQSIALHENILFSYFEEPKQMVNVKNDTEHESRVIDEWMKADPEAHFIHMAEGKGGNFFFLPAYFALGAEDLDGAAGKGEGL